MKSSSGQPKLCRAVFSEKNTEELAGHSSLATLSPSEGKRNFFLFPSLQKQTAPVLPELLLFETDSRSPSSAFPPSEDDRFAFESLFLLKVFRVKGTFFKKYPYGVKGQRPLRLLPLTAP